MPEDCCLSLPSSLHSSGNPYLRYISRSVRWIINYKYHQKYPGTAISQSVEHWATSWAVEEWGSILGRGKGALLFTASRSALATTHPPTQRLPVLKRPYHEADHSPPSSIEVKILGYVLSLPKYVFMAMGLITCTE
jgi:hypothetical protein